MPRRKVPARRFTVTGGDRPLRYDPWPNGPIIDPARYRTLAEAEAEALELIAAGKRGVTVDEWGRIRRWWPMCTAVADGYHLPGGRWWPTHMCGRHLLYDDGWCAEHTSGRRQLPERGVQLALALHDPE